MARAWFELSKAERLRGGKDVLIIASGIMTMRLLKLAKDLAADKVGVAVLHYQRCMTDMASAAKYSARGPRAG